MGKFKISILHHRLEDKRTGKHRLVNYLAESWNKTGLPTNIVYGIAREVSSEIVFMHLDLSLVPEAYINFGVKFPNAVNLKLTDIRKHRFCSHRVLPGEVTTEPVIVKSDYNYNSIPEGYMKNNFKAIPLREKIFFSKDCRYIQPPALAHRQPAYSIFKNSDSVPAEDWQEGRIVERFLPERENDTYVLRLTFFLGSRHLTLKLKSTESIIKHENIMSLEECETPISLLEWIKEKELDYGKIDYAIHEGKPVIYDVNKTPAASLEYPEWRGRIVDELSPGILDFL